MLGDLGSLAAGVIYQAWADAGAGIVRGARRAESEKDRHEAARFLTADHGPWAQSRRHWAEIAGVCPDQIRQRALEALGPKVPVEQPFAPVPQRMPRPGTKLSALVELLRHPEGITFDEMQERFGWSRVTCSTAISGDLPHKFGIRSKRGPDGRYRLVQVEHAST
ncbi:DUF3489 domain-containing protein [Sphingobium indicum]|uniref:DUF3489 domain-containing protein n=1 Tax=Sphingobium indicum (strain DSM 16412 / CCM 7286 / MTCC 6364 / B90A) TaxID=861109 RepID=A0A1L5BRH0_SPHIB|nr:DUF3489 domain-containing protein [Sphingobium indicum]APL95491.1 hypothetical protein SIDU_13760 [Sphingobium indicum B90A]